MAALPLACLVEAVHALADRDRLDSLVDHSATMVTADDPEDWLALPARYDTVGRADAACASLTTLDYECIPFVRQPGLYAGLEPR